MRCIFLFVAWAILISGGGARENIRQNSELYDGDENSDKSTETISSVAEKMALEREKYDEIYRNIRIRGGPTLRDELAKEKERNEERSLGKLLNIEAKEEKEAANKLGHRRVHKSGEITYKQAYTIQIAASIQMGVRYCIHSQKEKPLDQLERSDFVETISKFFPADGTNTTPRHDFPEFTFTHHAYNAFRSFRILFGIQQKDFVKAFCDEPLQEVSNPGSSGSVFFLTQDNDFILKTVQEREATVLQGMLTSYTPHLKNKIGTLLPKFFGLFTYEWNLSTINLIVMNNLFPSNIKIHMKYDLKGSLYNKRKASERELKKKSPTYKDLDFLEKNPDGITLNPKYYKALMSAIEKDCQLLKTYRIMDYSLLVGIHYLDKAESEYGTENTERALSSKVSRRDSVTKQSMENIFGNDGALKAGGIPATNKNGERLLLFVGIIDVLQDYRLTKKVEHVAKGVLYDASDVSVGDAGFYANRFLNFMKNTVFKSE